MTPVCDLCNVILSILSLFPGKSDRVTNPLLTEIIYNWDKFNNIFKKIIYINKKDIYLIACALKCASLMLYQVLMYAVFCTRTVGTCTITYMYQHILSMNLRQTNCRATVLISCSFLEIYALEEANQPWYWPCWAWLAFCEDWE